MTRWELVVATPATRTLDRLSAGVASAIVEFMLGPLSDQPTVVGKPLQRELAGYWSARRGAYRVVYRVDEPRHRVVVVRIDHRSDVYRRREPRTASVAGTSSMRVQTCQQRRPVQ